MARVDQRGRIRYVEGRPSSVKSCCEDASLRARPVISSFKLELVWSQNWRRPQQISPTRWVNVDPCLQAPKGSPESNARFVGLNWPWRGADVADVWRTPSSSLQRTKGEETAHSPCSCPQPSVMPIPEALWCWLSVAAVMVKKTRGRSGELVGASLQAWWFESTGLSSSTRNGMEEQGYFLFGIPVRRRFQ